MNTALRPVDSVPQRVLVATTAMLTFISFWRAAAVVLNDMGSSAFYAGAIAEHFVGKSAPWFILTIMLLSFAVRALYIESCSMFVRGGVYRVVKEAMGARLAKFSVSALMFDYILTGPISGVSAGLYLTGLLNEVLRYAAPGFELPMNSTAALIAIAVTVYFWRENLKGIPESSEKALRIMYVTTVMVVLMTLWCIWTIAVRGVQIPPLPLLANVVYSDDALGWLRGSSLPYTFGLVGILIGLGHSVLAMSGEETMAQVYREIEHPKLSNLKKAGLVIFIYSLIFTAGVAFFAVMITPDSVRSDYSDNPIGGLAMYLIGPLPLRIAFRAFVAVVGTLMLAGAVNTSIVGSNGVLNRVSEDGILPHWFRQPHHRFGTSHRILNLVAVLQIATIILSRGNIFVLGEAYAFGVMWSFATKGLAVLVLRYRQPEKREFRVPWNPRVRNREIPLGLGAITLALVTLCFVNLFTKQVATIAGLTFTLVLFLIFSITERTTRKRSSAQAHLDQFNIEERNRLTPQDLGIRPGCVLVMVRNYNTLYNLGAALDRVDLRHQDVVVLNLRMLKRSGGNEYELTHDQLFGLEEQKLFTRALEIAEKRGKTIHLCVAAATEKWEAILKAARNVDASDIVLGASPNAPAVEEARLAGLAWEHLENPKCQFNLRICFPSGREQVFHLGPHAPRLTLAQIDLLHEIWLDLSADLAPKEVHHDDIVDFALRELRYELSGEYRHKVLSRMHEHLQRNEGRLAH